MDIIIRSLKTESSYDNLFTPIYPKLSNQNTQKIITLISKYDILY